MKGRPLFLSFLKNLDEKRSDFHFLGSEFRPKNEKPTVAILQPPAYPLTIQKIKQCIFDKLGISVNKQKFKAYLKDSLN